MRIYISGPYTENPDKWTKMVEEVGVHLMKKGHTPFMPHKHFYGMEKRNDVGYDDFMRVDLEWLYVCDAILYLRTSPGADVELEVAKKLKKIIYNSVAEVPDEELYSNWVEE
jgi:hypothetical protein